MAWLAGDADGVASATELALALAFEMPTALADELACGATAPAWAGQAGRKRLRRTVCSSPGSGDAARAMWVRPGAPTRPPSAWLTPSEERLLRYALEELLALEARPAAAIVARRLRDRG